MHRLYPQNEEEVLAFPRSKIFTFGVKLIQIPGSALMGFKLEFLNGESLARFLRLGFLPSYCSLRFLWYAFL
jgi:hypothetical protein